MGPKDNPEGVLYVVSTPIGNLKDITLRALDVLGEVDLIACEDTRRTRKLLSYYQLSTPCTSYFEGNRVRKGRYIISRLLEGCQVALVTEAGTPCISDPGNHLVRLAVEHEQRVVPIPGPSALTAALSIAGSPGARFFFHGFLPTKGRGKVLRSLKEMTATLVFYESPHRVRRTLEDILTILGDRFVVMARELTKIYEEVRRDKVSALLEELDGSAIKGEVTLLVFPEKWRG